MSKLIPSDLPDPFEELISAGNIEEVEIIENVFTGEVIEIRRTKRTAYDPTRGEWAIIEQVKPLTLACGCVVVDPEAIVFCQECGAAVCSRHGVVDEVCGRPLCLQHSRMVELDGRTVRVCRECAKKLKWRKIVDGVRSFFLGRRR